MHVTDWFSTTWNSVLGHKSSGIVDDFYWRPDALVAGNLSGNFNPNDTGSYDGGSDYNNLKGGNGLCVFNGMSFNSGRGIGDPSFFESDGADDFIGTCSLGGGAGYSDPDLTIDLSSSFTISIWTLMETTHSARIWSLGNVNAGFDGGDPGIALASHYEGLVLDIGEEAGNSAEFQVGDGSAPSNKHGKSSLERNRWYHLTFVHNPSGNMGGIDYVGLGDVYQFYIDGVRTRVHPPEPFETYRGVGVQKISIGSQQTDVGAYITTEGHKFGHFHFYSGVLPHSKVRQNYLATNQYYYTLGSGYSI